MYARRSHRSRRRHLCFPRRRTTAHPERPLKSAREKAKNKNGKKRSNQNQFFFFVRLFECVCVNNHAPPPPSSTPPLPITTLRLYSILFALRLRVPLGLVLALPSLQGNLSHPPPTAPRLSACLLSLFIITAAARPSCRPCSSFRLLLSAAERSGLRRGQRYRIKENEKRPNASRWLGGRCGWLRRYTDVQLGITG